jgi:hypothetical protein
MPFHAKRSPSQTKRFRSCPGSIILCATLPIEQQNPVNEAGLIGTCVHKIIEDALHTGADLETFRDRIIVLEGDDHDARILRKGAKAPKGSDPWFVIDDAMIEGAKVMVDYVYDRCFDLDINSASRNHVQLETRTNPLPDRDDTSGTADVTLDAYPECLEVVDYKNGWNLVDHRDNDQLRSYLLGKVLEALAAKRKYKRYCITIVQPNAPHDEGRIRTTEYTVAELLEYQTELRADIAKNEEAENAKGAPKPDWETVDAKWAKAYLRASEDACFWCDARAVCPARKTMAQDVAKVKLGDPAFAPDDFVAARGPGNLKDAEAILAWAPAMENLIAAANTYVTRALEAGKTSDKFKLVRGRSNRVWADDVKDMTPAQLAKELRKSGLGDIDPAALTVPAKLKSGPQVESALPAKLRKKFDSLYLHKPEGRPTLAPIDDPRPAIGSNAQRNLAGDSDDFEFNDDEDFG